MKESSAKMQPSGLVAGKLAGRALHLLVVCLLSLITWVGSEEYCLTQSFQATCQPGEVIMMEHAHFGRLALGRCVTRNFGHLGCYKDVISQLDHACSGRRECELSVSDNVLVRTKPCPQDFSSYLDATYDCIKVTSPVCEAAPRHVISDISGYISSFHHPRDGGPCIYEMLFPPGQKVNITLLDFTLRNETLYGDRHLKFCQQYAIIEEPRIGNSITVCGGEQRRKHVYLSRTSHVILRLVSTESARFLIQYDVVGCSTIPLPEGTYSRQEEDALFVICNVTGESFLLRCRHNTWVGELKNCSVPAAIENAKVTDSPVSFGGMPPLGISVVIIFGVAMVIVVYIAIMIVCVLFIRRRKRRRRRAEAEAVLSKIPVIEDPYGTVLKGIPKVTGAEERLPMLGKPQPLFRANGGEYTDICEMHEIGNCLDFHSNYIRGSFAMPGQQCPGNTTSCGAPTGNYSIGTGGCGMPNTTYGGGADIGMGAPCTASVESLRCHPTDAVSTSECIYTGSRSLKSFQVNPPPSKPPSHAVFFHTEPLVPEEAIHHQGEAQSVRQGESDYGKVMRGGTRSKDCDNRSPDLVPDNTTRLPVARLTVNCPKTDGNKR